MKELLLSLAEESTMKTYSQFPIIIERGNGAYLYDIEGKKYLDMGSGIGVNSLGHNNRKLVDGIKEQAEKLLHISNLYYNKPQIEVADILVNHSCFHKVFFCNSGAEANEAAIKLARKYGSLKSSKKTKIITMKEGFHGRTYGALSATAQPVFWKNFGPMTEGFEYVEFNNIEEFKMALRDDVCGVLMEVIQGESGINPAQKEFIKEVRELTKANDTVLIVDEVQTGIGRTGKLFAFEHYGIEPDVVTLAKGLGGGVPIGAVLCKDKYSVFEPKDHGTTFGGNPLATTAAKIVLGELLENSLMDRVQDLGKYFDEQLIALKEKHPSIREIRGIGLMKAVEMDFPVGNLIKRCLEKGLLLVGSKENIIRLLPPLIIEEKEVLECISILDECIGEENKNGKN